MAPLETLVQGGHGLTSPTFDRRGRLLVASSNSGEVHQVVTEGASSTLQTIFNTGGSPAWATCHVPMPQLAARAALDARLRVRAAVRSWCARQCVPTVTSFPALDHAGSPSSLCVDVEGAVFVCDVAHQAVFRHGEDGQLSEFVKEYEAKPFKGPSAMLLDSGGNMFFTDSGPLGETTLQSPKGSIFLISADGQLLQPLLLEALAHPCALALGLDERVIFVAEKMQVRHRAYRVHLPSPSYLPSLHLLWLHLPCPSRERGPVGRSVRTRPRTTHPYPAEPAAAAGAAARGRLPLQRLPPAERRPGAERHRARPAGQPVRDPVRLRPRGGGRDETGHHLQDLAGGQAPRGDRHPGARAHGHLHQPGAGRALRHRGVDQRRLPHPALDAPLAARQPLNHSTPLRLAPSASYYLDRFSEDRACVWRRVPWSDSL